MRFLGIDLAWGHGTPDAPPNESGLVALDPSGTILDAGWARGLDEVVKWVEAWSTPDTLLFVDAPLVVLNETGMRECEREVGRRYGRWKVAANASNRQSTRSAGIALRERLEKLGWSYDDGTSKPASDGRRLSECYPYTALVGAHEFGYVRDTGDRVGQRPRYKRPPKKMPAASWHPARAENCDALIARFATFEQVSPPIALASHAATAELVDVPSPHKSADYKHREDLLDAAICAWTAALWHRNPGRCRVLGAADELADATLGRATIIAPRVCSPQEVTSFQRVVAMADVVVAADAVAAEPTAPPAIQPKTPASKKAPTPVPASAVSTPGKLDFAAAEAFIAAIPAGRWSSYADVAAAAGAPKGAQALGTWLLTSERNIPNMHRVLRTTGEIGGGWSPAVDGLPTTADGVHALLESEKVPFDLTTGRAGQQARWRGSDG